MRSFCCSSSLRARLSSRPFCCLRDAREALLRAVEPRAQRLDARRELAGVVRHGAARLLHAHPAVLRFAQRLVQILQRAALVPHARLEAFREAPVQHALGEPRLLADDVGLVVIGRGEQRGFEPHDARPLVALLRGAERGDVLRGFDLVELPAGVGALRAVLVEPARGEHRVGLRHALGVGALARVEHVVEGDDAVLPLRQRAAEEGEIAVVLEAFLEIVAGEQVVQVARLRRVRQLTQLPEPAVVVVLVALAAACRASCRR